MLQEELWVLRLAEHAGLQLTTVESLLQALGAQLEQRLLAGQTLDLQELGCWSLRTETEWIAELPDGELWLIPPQLYLELEAEATEGGSIALPALATALAEACKLSLGLVSTWLELLPRHWATFLEQHQFLHWPGLGIFRLAPEGYTLQLSSSFAEGLNKPFAMFVPVRLGPDYLPQGELEQRPLSSLESLASLYTTLRYEARQPEPIPEEPTTLPAEITPALEADTLSLEKAPAEEEVPQVKEESSSPLAVEAVTDVSEEAHPLVGEASQPAVTIPPAAEEAKPRSYSWLLLLLGLIAGLLLGLGGYYLYNAHLSAQSSTSFKPKKAQPTLPAPPSARPTQSAQLDSATLRLDSARQDSLAPTLEPRLRGDSTETRVLRPGDRLTRLAYQKYGHKAFWVYIYQENEAKLQDPDKLPLGKRITLPAASKYRINALDTNSVRRALVLQRNLWNKK
ncbi:LysM peptidoglycan-binding domain-containing protein [Porphyromonas sp.]